MQRCRQNILSLNALPSIVCKLTCRAQKHTHVRPVLLCIVTNGPPLPAGHMLGVGIQQQPVGAPPALNANSSLITPHVNMPNATANPCQLLLEAPK